MGSGKQWDDLFRGFARREEDKQRREDEERMLVAFFDEQTKLVMDMVREVALERARSFEQLTGRKVEVRWPSRPPINVGPDGPFMSFMSLGIGTREVHLYSHRVGASEPMIHYVLTGDEDASKGRKRLHSKPGCRLEKRASGGFLLRDAANAQGGPELSVDDLAFRAFEVLLNACA